VVNLESGRRVGFHDFADVASKLDERGADMASVFGQKTEVKSSVARCYMYVQ
jgi:hypothetical protein